MKLIILILASDNEFYIKCQELWRSYMNTHNNIQSYFIKLNNNINEDVLLKDDTIFIKGEESLVPGCLYKTIKSIEYILQNENFEFDYIFRTNMSSVVDLNKFYELLCNSNNFNYSGIIGHCVKRDNIEVNSDFISGAGILMSKNICKQLIDSKELLNYNLIDDVSIGVLLKNADVKLTSLTRFEAFNYENNVDLINEELIKDFYHFRCRSSDYCTIELMKKIISIVYKDL